MYTLRLNALERLVLQDLLPSRAPPQEAILCARIRKKLVLTEEEQELVGLRAVPSAQGQGFDCKDQEHRWEIEIQDAEMEHLINYARTFSWPTWELTEQLIGQLEDVSSRSILSRGE